MWCTFSVLVNESVQIWLTSFDKLGVDVNWQGAPFPSGPH
jgi:hypothetical protein